MSEISEVIASEIADFFAGFGGPGEPDIQSGKAQRLLTKRLLSVLALRERAEPVAYRYRFRPTREAAGKWILVDTLEEANPLPKYEIQPLYTAPPAPVVPKIDRKAICNKAHWLCARSPGATFYNAAEYALDEVAELLAPPAPVVPDEIIDLLHAARSYVKSCAGSDGHAFGVLMAIDRVCHSSMLQPVRAPYKLPEA
ncbi:hypothetical protein SM100_003288 [Cronobacter sakazakii]|nr:hypothetical protein [Cronobacter sakazakii]